MTKAEQAALDAANKLVATTPEEETTEETTITAEEETVEDGPVFSLWDVELPEDLAQELLAPELDEAALEREARNELEQEDDDFDELSPQEQNLLLRARKAEKEAKHYRDLRATDSRKTWVEEANKFFPLAAHVLEDIKADSRRSFLRKAKEAHEAVLPYVKQVQESAAEVVAAEKEKARAEARVEAEKSWGRVPSSSPAPASAEREAEESTIRRNRVKGDLASTLKSMMFSKGE